MKVLTNPVEKFQSILNMSLKTILQKSTHCKEKKVVIRTHFTISKTTWSARYHVARPKWEI